MGLCPFVHRAAGLAAALVLVAARPALAADPSGAPPPDLDKVATGPAGPREAPKVENPSDGTTVSVSAGGLNTTGNSRMVAATGSGSIDTRFDASGLGASVVGNFGRSAAPGARMRTTAENVQGRARYDYYLVDQASLFALATGRRDRLQGLAFRLNLDPGFKYLCVNRKSTSLWGEAGYDFQYDVRTEEGRRSEDDPTVLLDKTATDHSVRLFLGFRHAFNDRVTLSNGIEYLQSFIETERYRVNYDVLFTAQLVGGLALGTGFGARYDNGPLPGKEKLDTSTTVSLVYSYTSAEGK